MADDDKTKKTDETPAAEEKPKRTRAKKAEPEAAAPEAAGKPKRSRKKAEETAAEQADTELKKAQARGAYVDMGAVDGFDVRSTLIADKHSGFNGMDPVVQGGPGDRDAELEAAAAEQSSGSEVNPDEDEAAE